MLLSRAGEEAGLSVALTGGQKRPVCHNVTWPAGWRGRMQWRVMVELTESDGHSETHEAHVGGGNPSDGSVSDRAGLAGGGKRGYAGSIGG